jgi:hypothetical protein
VLSELGLPASLLASEFAKADLNQVWVWDADLNVER